MCLKIKMANTVCAYVIWGILMVNGIFSTTLQPTTESVSLVYDKIPSTLVYDKTPSTLVYDKTPSTLVYDKTPSTLVYDKTPSTMVYDKTPSTLVYDKTPSTLVYDKTPSALVYDKTPSTLVYDKTPSVWAEDYELPDHWRSFCYVSDDFYLLFENAQKERFIYIRCNVHSEHSGVWKMKDLRENLKKYNGTNTNFEVFLQCQTMSNISLSLPFNVYNLFRLEVTNCVITDFFQVYYEADDKTKDFEATPDSISTLNLTDCVIYESENYTDWYLYGFYVGSNGENQGKYACIHQNTIQSFSFVNITSSIKNKRIPKTDNDSKFPAPYLVPLGMRPCWYGSLEYVDRSHNPGSFVNFVDYFLIDPADLTRLKTYNMSYNQIEVLNYHQVDGFQKLVSIKTIDLSHNNFSYLIFNSERFPWRFTTEILSINLQYNNISTFTLSDLESEWMLIDLRNNPMNCSCSSQLTEILSHIREGKHINTSYEYIGDLQCDSPAVVAGKTFKSLSSDMVCEQELRTEYFLVPIYILSAVIITLSIFFIIVVKFRQEISIILFTRFNIVFPCHKRENNDTGKIYDAFVSYSSSEDDFVENFFKDLENTRDGTGKPSFKFCMHHRDFIPGKTIFDNVTRAIESSRHTIILVSNHFIDSEFCLYEFQEAFRQSIMEKQRHLVIVLLEEIPEAKLPRDLRRCMNTFTYIKKDDILFKERLIYALNICKN